MAASISASIGLLGFFALGLGLLPVKYDHRRVTFMASRKRIMKMAQLEPLGSSRGMFAGSFSMEVGVLDVVDIVTVAEVALGDAGTEMDTKCYVHMCQDCIRIGKFSFLIYDGMRPLFMMACFASFLP